MLNFKSKENNIMASLRNRVNSTLQIKIQKKGEGISLYFNIFLSILIFLNTIAIILHSIPDLSKNYNQHFIDFEVFL